nr:ABC transporter substrate-binding protein [Marinitoga lauensis]
MVILQQEPVSFMSLKSSGITKPEDFKGKVLGSAGFAYLESQLLLKKAQLSKKDVTFKRWTFNMDSFYKGDFDVIPIYITNEPDLARSAGMPSILSNHLIIIFTFLVIPYLSLKNI